MPRFPAESLRAFVSALLEQASVSRNDAVVVAESLVDANLCGHDSHGVARIIGYLDQIAAGEMKPDVPLVVEHESPAMVACDAQLGFGQVQIKRLADRTAAKARDCGVACGTARNCGHIGRLGEYTERLAQDGLAALLSVNDNGVFRCVAPPGGKEARVSTNPVSLAVPLPSGPFVYDASTSVVAQGKVMVRRLSGEPCPPGWLQDADGKPSTDPHVLLEKPPGTLLPLGGIASHKGFGLSVLLDILTAGVAGGRCPPAPDDAPMCNNVLLVVWDAERIYGSEHLGTEGQRLVDWIRSCPLCDDADAIHLPGDSSEATRSERTVRGIPLDEGNWQALVDLAQDRNVRLPEPIT